MAYVRVYFISLVIFIFCDFIWLRFIAKSMYSNYLGYLMGDVVWWAVIVFYLLFIVGLEYFCIMPAITAGSVVQALFSGALFGLVTYATYDLTNQATIKGWPMIVTFIDLLWGSFLGAIVSAVSTKTALLLKL